MFKLACIFNPVQNLLTTNTVMYFSTTIAGQKNKRIPMVKNQQRLSMMAWFNKLRNVRGNYFRLYYYKRLPLIFRFYPYAYRTLLLRNVILPIFNMKGQKVWRKKLYRRNRQLFRLQQFFLALDVDLKDLKILLKKLKVNKNSSVKWQQLLKVHYNKKDISYANYNKYLTKFTATYLENKSTKIKYKNTLMVSKNISLSKLRAAYMLHIKFYKTQRMYYNFRKYKYSRRYLKRIKWVYKKRIKAKVNKSCFRSYRTSLSLQKSKPYRLQKRTRAYKYKRFSYYWLRYFFKRFKQMYIDNKQGQANYKDIKKYLLCWLWKVRTYKVLTLQSVNPARGFLLYKSNKLHNFLKEQGLFNGYAKLLDLHERNELDEIHKSLLNKNRKLYRNFYWRFYKSALERRKIQILKRHYRFDWALRPYISVHKKNKVFYHWGDRHLYKRYPLYRYKYTLFFKFPRFADYRRLFKNQLREQHVFRYLYRLKLSQLIKAFRKSTYKTKRSFELMFLKYFELRLDTVVHRLNFAWSLKHARQLVLRGLFIVNNKIINNNKYHVGLGDVIMPIKRLRMQPLSKKYLNYVDYGVTLSWNRLFYRPIQSDQYPAHFFLNERIPAGMVVNKFNPNTLRFNKPYSVQFLTLSLLKYN